MHCHSRNLHDSSAAVPHHRDPLSLTDRAHVPMSGRHEFVYLCAVLRVANGYDDHQFTVVALSERACRV